MKVMTIRIDDRLHAEVAKAAEIDGRSMNREIAHLLRSALSYLNPDRGKAETPGRRADPGLSLGGGDRT